MKGKRLLFWLILVAPGAAFLPLCLVAGEVKENWKAEWEKTVRAARTEGEVAVFSEPTPENERALREFQKSHPEIQLKLAPIGAGNFAQRVLAERRAGKYLADVFSGGSTSPTQLLAPARVLEPIRSAMILPEVTDESLWFRRKFHFADPEGEYVFLNDGTVTTDLISYNKRMVRPEEFRSHWDLLNPVWKGKIVAYDPRLPGGASSQMRFLYYNPKLGPKFIAQLFGQMDVTLSANRRQVMDWVATGKFPLGLFVGRELDTAKQQGLPVDEMIIKSDGAMLGSGAGSIMLIHRAPHPNAAKVFINWFLSGKGQTAWQRMTDRNSLRRDIPKDYLTNWKERVPQEDGHYIFTNLADYQDLLPGRKLVNEALQRAGK